LKLNDYFEVYDFCLALGIREWWKIGILMLKEFSASNPFIIKGEISIIHYPILTKPIIP